MKTFGRGILRQPLAVHLQRTATLQTLSSRVGNTSLFRFSGVTGDSILLLVKDRCHELDLPLAFCLDIL